MEAMIDLDDGDQLLNLVGIILLLFLILASAILVLIATSPQQQPAAKPDADWQLQKVNESYVRIRHAGGAPVQTENLTVTVDGTPRRPQWTAPTLTDGDAGVVRIGDGTRVTLLWSRSEADREVMKRWQLSR